MSVDVVPNARGFDEKLRAALRNVTVQVDAQLNDRGIREQLDALTRGRTATVNVDADTTAARAQIDALAHNRTVTVNVNASTGSAAAEIAGVDSAASSSVGSLGALATAGIALGPAIIPVAAAAAAAIAGIGVGATAATAGLGVFAAAIVPIVKAVTDQRAASQQAGAAATASAAAHQAAAARISSAQNSVRDAENGLSQARASGASAARRAAQAVSDAQQGVRSATQAAAQGVQQALAQEAVAERGLQDALRQETQAQQALSAARQQAKRDLNDLKNSVVDGALAQRQAALDVQSAAAANSTANADGSSATAQQRAQAQLNYDQAVQRQKELSLQQRRLRAQQQQADKNGVDGAPGVKSAQQNLDQARQGVADARARVAAAEKAVSDARVAGAQRVAEAEKQVTRARQAQADQARTSAASIQAAQDRLLDSEKALTTARSSDVSKMSTAAQKAQDSMQALTAPGRELADLIANKLIPGFVEISKIGQAPIAQGILDGLKAAKPLLPVVRDLFASLGDALGDLFRQAGQALGSPFWKDFFRLVATSAGPALKGLGDFVGNLVKGFAGIAEKFAPIGSAVGGALGNLAKRFKDFGTGKGNGLQRFFDYIQVEGPKVVAMFRSVLRMVGRLIDALRPIGDKVVDWIKKFSDAVNKIPVHTLREIAAAVVGVVVGLQAMKAASSAFSLLGGAATLLSNPVGLVVVGIAALAVGAVLLYRKFKPFHDFVHDKLLPVLKRIKDQALKGVREGIDEVKKAIDRNKPALQDMYDKFKKVATFLVTKVLPVLGPILRAALHASGTVIGLFIDSETGLWTAAEKLAKILSKAFNKIRDVVVGVWRNDIHPALSALKKFVTDTLPSAFTSAVTAIGKAWDGLKEAAKAPVRFVVNTVINDGLIDGFNGIVSKLFGKGKGPHISRISLPKGFHEGGYTGPGAKYQPAGIVHADEFVIRKESRAKIERDSPGLLDKLNGYADGGRVLYRPVRGGRISQGLHDQYTGFPAIDFAVPVGTPVAAAAAGRVSRSEDLRGNQNGGYRSYGRVIQIISNGFQTLYAHLSRRGVRVGDHVSGGQRIGLSGNTGHSTGPHLHFGAKGISPYAFTGGSTKFTGALGNAGADSSSDGSSLFDVLGALRKRIAGPLGKLGSLGSSPFAQLAAQVPRKLADSLLDKAKSFPGSVLSGAASGAVGAVKGVLSKAKILSVLTAAMGLTRLPAHLLDNWYRQVQSESGGNAGITQQITDVNSRSGNRAQGLLQVIPPTFRAYRSKLLPNDPFNALANAYAAMNYAKHRYGVGSLEGVIGHGHGYDSGGWLQPGTTVVHNNTGKPEPVFNPGQWKMLEAALATGNAGRTRTAPLVHVEHLDSGVDLDLWSRQAEFRERQGSFTG